MYATTSAVLTEYVPTWDTATPAAMFANSTAVSSSNPDDNPNAGPNPGPIDNPYPTNP